MSLAFNDTTNLAGIIQLIEDELGMPVGAIANNTTRLKQWTTRINLAFDDFLAIAIPSSGTWQYDDSNFTDYPIIRTNIVSGQRDYTITSDESGNLVLDIFSVRILPSATATTYTTLKGTDDTRSGNSNFTTSSQGTPTQYDKLGNGIRFDLTPNYNATNGIEVQVNRAASYFSYSDTSKKPGVPAIFHEWFVVRPAEKYASRHSRTHFPGLRADRLEMEAKIRAYFSERPRDERPRLQVRADSNK